MQNIFCEISFFIRYERGAVMCIIHLQFTDLGVHQSSHAAVNCNMGLILLPVCRAVRIQVINIKSYLVFIFM